MTGANALTQSLKQYGVKTIFGLPGVQLDDFFDSLYDEQDSIRLIHTRHEQAAAYMAFGAAQSTGEVQVCTVVPGPGVFNAGAALSTAYACNAPVLLVTGQIPSKHIGKGTGQLHELADQQGVVKSVTKWVARAETGQQGAEMIRDAYIQLNTGCRRPVMVEMAPDIMRRVDEVALLDPLADFSIFETPLDQDLVEQAASILGNAENPAIFCGGGVFGAEAELMALADQLQAPVFMSPNGQGAVDCRHYLGHNLLAAEELWGDIDVMLVVGTRFIIPNAWPVKDDVKLIRIEADPTRPDGLKTPEIRLSTTAKQGLSDLVDRSARHNRSRASREDELNNVKAKAQEDFRQIEPQAGFSDAIRKALPDDGIVAFGVTQLGFYSWFGFPTYHPRSNIQPGYQGTLGYAFPTGLGAQAANPDKKVIAVTGDGGFMFNVQELATAAQHGINLVTVLFNDGAFGNVKRNQKNDYNGRYIASDLQNPDFMKLADGFGVMGQRVETPDALGAAIERAFKADVPALIEVPVGEMPTCWPHMPMIRDKDKAKDE